MVFGIKNVRNCSFFFHGAKLILLGVWLIVEITHFHAQIVQTVSMHESDTSINDGDYDVCTLFIKFAVPKFNTSKITTHKMKIALRHVIAVLILVLQAGSGLAVMQVHNLGVSAGLANGYVRAICQDRDGYVWIATNDGLSRFDGHGFINYNKNNSGLSGNELNSLAVCTSDPYKLWIATQRNGLCYYDSRTGRIEHVSEEVLRSPDITSIMPSADGGLWLAHYHFGVQYYNPATGESRIYDSSNVTGMPTQTWTVAEGEGGRLYIGHIGGGMSVLDPKTYTIKNYTHNPGDKASLPGKNVYSICIDRSGEVWMGTENGAALLNPRTGTITPFVHDDGNPASIAPGQVWDICQLDNEELWFGTSQGGGERTRFKIIYLCRYKPRTLPYVAGYWGAGWTDKSLYIQYLPGFVRQRVAGALQSGSGCDRPS